MNDMHLVLHGLAIKKHGAPDEIAGIVGLAQARVGELLGQATAGGRAVESQGKYLLTPAGRMILDGHYSRYYDALRKDTGFIDVYQRFELLNVEMKQVVTDWQTVALGGERVPNDHADEDYDEKIIDRLSKVHERIEPMLASLAGKVARLGRYRDKLEFALDKAEEGEHAWVSDVRLESYHTVWFEMHEDLLRILGRERDE